MRVSCVLSFLPDMPNDIPAGEEGKTRVSSHLLDKNGTLQKQRSLLCGLDLDDQEGRLPKQ